MLLGNTYLNYLILKVCVSGVYQHIKAPTNRLMPLFHSCGLFESLLIDSITQSCVVMQTPQY